jgi:predicted nucleic acid-binding Zn ribbon protein
MLNPRKCVACQKQFRSKLPSQRYCSDRCKNRAAQQRFVKRRKQMGAVNRWIMPAKKPPTRASSPRSPAYVADHSSRRKKPTNESLRESERVSNSSRIKFSKYSDVETKRVRDALVVTRSAELGKAFPNLMEFINGTQELEDVEDQIDAWTGQKTPKRSQ